MKRLQQTYLAWSLLAVYWSGMWISSWAIAGQSQELIELAEVHMGTKIRLLAYAADKEKFQQAAQAAFQRIAQLDSSFSDYRSDSELMRLCASAPHPEPVAVSQDLWEVLRLSVRVSEASGGAFDVTVGNLTRLWRRARRQHVPPTDAQLQAARATVDYRQIELSGPPPKVKLTRPGIRIDLGGIAKGCVAQEALQVLERHGFRSALVDAGGDLVVGEPPPESPGWAVAVAGLQRDGPPLERFHASRCAIATSGDLWQFFEFNGRRYSHILDPRRGWGVEGPRSVTVVARNGALADALATAISVLKPDEGLRLADQFHAAALYVYSEADQIHTFRSPNFPNLPPQGNADR